MIEYLGKRVEVEDLGYGTIVFESERNVTVSLEAEGFLEVVIPKTSLESVYRPEKSEVAA